MASTSSGRCAQAECIASRNELELCRRDLDELESEFDQLHEQLARKESECGALALRLQQREQEAQDEAARLSEQLSSRGRDVEQLSGALKECEEKLQALRQQRDGDRQPTPSGDSAVDTLKAENAALNATVKELRAAIARETAASAHANQQVSRIQQESKDKRDELYEALKENELLRRERQERDEALEKVSQLALDYELTLKVLHDQQRDYLEALDVMRIDNMQQRTRIEQLEREKESHEAKLIEMDEHESQVDTIVRELMMKHDMEKAVLRNELDELRKKATEMRQQSERQTALSNRTTSRSALKSGDADLEDLERQLELVHEIRVRDQLKLDERDHEIQQLRQDMQALVEHLNEGGSETRRAIDHAVEAETRKYKAASQESISLKRRLKEQAEMIEQLEFLQAQLEKDLVNAQEWNAKYEAGAGLEDVMKYQKKLRRELEKQQLANQKLRQEVNDQREATGKLHVAFERLKAEVGKSADFEYDDLAIESHLKGELAVQKAEMEQMEHQIHELESERVRLLQKLRDQARVVGTKLYEAHGLSTDQWEQVEEFIERVKLTPEVAKRWLVHPEASAPVTTTNSTVSDQNEEIRRLKLENTRLREDLEEKSRKGILQLANQDESKRRGSAEPSTMVTVATSPVRQAAVEEGVHEDGVADGMTTSSRMVHFGDDSQTSSNIADQEPTRTNLNSPKDPPPPTAEVLAQAIASALESRLQFLHDNSQKTSIPSTQSVAIQPSPPKAPSMDNTLLAFDTEGELIQQADFLREFQLLLDEYVKLEGQNQVLQEQLVHQETAWKSLMDQQSLIYQHFFHVQDTFVTEKAKMLFDKQQLKTHIQELQLKCQRYEATLHTLESASARDVDDAAIKLRSELVGLTRCVAHDEVAFGKLKREHELLQEEYRLTLTEAQHIECDWLEMERVLKYRILYLESWKTGAEELMMRTESTLDKCVLKSLADRTHRELEITLSKHCKLSEEYVELHTKYLSLYDVPAQLHKLQYENTMLVAERAARQGEPLMPIDAVSHSRIVQLESELEQQVTRVKELEEKFHTNLLSSQTNPTTSANVSEDRVRTLEAENTILCERISEVEQLYEGLVRDNTKSKQDAELAASQAHVLSRKITQEKARLSDKEDQLRELMAASEDHAIIARLQQQLIHMKSSYQQFLLKYDHVVTNQQHASMMLQHIELQMENQAKACSDEREKARNEVLVLEAATEEFKQRDYTMRNNKWEAFKRRLDGLEEEIRMEQDRRRVLEKDLEEKQAELPFKGSASSASMASAAEVTRLRSRIDSLETRERVLIGQLDVLSKTASVHSSSTGSKEEDRLRKEVGELKRVHTEVMRQLQSLQSRNAELLQLNNDLESQKRAVLRDKDDLEIEYQQLHARCQVQLGNNYQASSPTSPIMRKKVGLYEKDHIEQQQAAQASIASLKQLLNEKNAVIAEYQKKIASIRADVAATKAQERADASHLHKKLYEENQRMIGQLKEASEKIRHLEKAGGDKKALKAAQDRHEYALQEWKRAEVELEAARGQLRKLEIELKAVQNERDIAEARAGEALEEIILNQDKIQKLEKEKKTVEDHLGFVKRDMTKREEKMQLLREAIIRLKEEFLKAEDRHAVELAKAQNVVRNTKQTKSDNEREREQWNEDKEQLEAQVQILQEKFVLAKKGEEKAKLELTKVTKQLRTPKVSSGQGSNVQTQGENGPPRTTSALEFEVERLKNALKDKVVSEARTIEDLEKKVKVLQAQNIALRESAATDPNPTPRAGDISTDKSGMRQQMREQWEGEKRLQRRVDVVTIRLKEKQIALEKSEKENERLRQRLSDSESKLKEMQRMASSAREAIQGTSEIEVKTDTFSGTRSRRNGESSSELERQNAFLQETLVLKRKEWEDSFQDQMERYEEQLHRLRSRLGKRHTSGESMSALEREERDFVAGHDVRDELLALGDEMRVKERLLMEKDTRLLELELELESLRVEYQRLHRKNVTAPANPAASITASTHTRRVKTSAQERLELEEVVENMKKVIEKLRSENDRLRKAASSIAPPDKVEALRKKLNEARDARQELQSEVELLRTESSELKKDKLRLQQRLRVLTSSRSSPAKKFVDDDTQRSHQLLLTEKDAQIAELQGHIVKKDALIRELSAKLGLLEKAQPESPALKDAQEKIIQLQSQVNALAHENDQLRQELGAFDQEFFEEIEDLKYKYAQAVREKQQLERLLRDQR